MNGDDCQEMRLLVQADIDGELSPAEAALMVAHLADCDSCAAVAMEFSALSERVRRETAYHRAPPSLRKAVAATIERTAASKVSTVIKPVSLRARYRQRLRLAIPFTAGLTIAAGLAIAVVAPQQEDLAAVVVADHIRALQPGHLTDVTSTDQHTVKPWFDGRLDFAPAVKDFSAEGYLLVGGRLDYLVDHPAAALVYKHGQHLIDFYVWPHRSGSEGSNPSEGSRSGYNFRYWTGDQMVFWAVSDLNPDELADFVRLLRVGDRR